MKHIEKIEDFKTRKEVNELDIFDTQAYTDNPMDFYVVCTDVKTGKAVYINSDEAGDDALEYFRASASMPLVSKVVKIKGRELLDGGIADSVPIQYFESIGYDRNVIILTQPQGFVKKPSSAVKVMKLILKKYPMVIKAMENRHNEYNETIDYITKKEQSGEVLVIRPESALEIGRIEHNPDVLQRVYDLGRQAGKKHLTAVKEFIKK